VCYTETILLYLSSVRYAEIETMRKIPYASIIKSIMYAMIYTRPYVSYVLSVINKHQANPNITHWTAVKTILKYLRRTKDMFLIYGGEIELIVRVSPMLVSRLIMIV
jgi:hypothetical protein